MSKGLEALEQLHRLAYGDKFSIQEIKQSSIIEQELKEHEQYKAIEDELGIKITDLMALLNAKKTYKSIYSIHPHKGILKVVISGFDLENHIIDVFSFEGGSVSYGFDKFGKQLAFTREELEK